MATNPQLRQSPGYEKTDASPRGLVYFVAVIAAFLAIMAALLIWLFSHYQKTETNGSSVARPFEAVEPLPPAPRIQPDPRIDMRTYFDSQQQTLNTYGWIDRQNGIVRLPIDRAMELLLERGLPARSTNRKESAGANQERTPKAESAESQGAGQ
jgi:hypothetical protein